MPLSRLISKAFTGEAKYYDIFHRNKDYKGEAERIKKRFPEARTVLEVGCGTGNLTVELEKLGFEVTCIEPSGEMLKYFKGKRAQVIQTTIQEFVSPYGEKYDLLLATYDALNYVPPQDWAMVWEKIWELAYSHHIEVWDGGKPMRLLTHKRAEGCHRLRFGFRLMDRVYLWFVFWGKGLVISHHRLYL